MNETLTEQNYPIQSAWTLKLFLMFVVTFIGYLPIFIVVDLIWRDSSLTGLSQSIATTTQFDFFLVIFAIVIAFPFLNFFLLYFEKNNFHFTLDQTFITIRQGFLAKQERNVPYATIQNVFVSQDFLDRLLGLWTFTLENASDSNLVSTRKRTRQRIGVYGNQVIFPGLTSDAVEQLKAAILERMKANPTANNLSGL